MVKTFTLRSVKRPVAPRTVAVFARIEAMRMANALNFGSNSALARRWAGILTRAIQDAGMER